MDLIGTVVSQYQITEQIGHGGMATVYKAYQPSLDRYVALKVLAAYLSDTEDFIARFEREAKTIAKLRHRNILTIFDYGRHDKLFYLAMEYVRGGTLKERLGWPHPFDYAVDTITQIGQALAYGHRAGIIHRDIKPGNILVAEEDWLLLSDFGLVKMVRDTHRLTLSGASVGTPQYMSPEQAQGLKADHRSDIYSLGVVLYETITGQPPFGVENPVAVMRKQVSDPVPPPRKLRSDIPEEMEEVMLKALAKSPEDRYQQMEDFLADLHEAYALVADITSPYQNIGQVTPQTPPNINAIRLKASIYPHKLRSKRSFPWAAMLIGICLIFIAGLVYLILKDSVTALAAVLTPITPSATLSPTIATDQTSSTTLLAEETVTPEPTATPTLVTPSPVPETPSPTPTATVPILTSTPTAPTVTSSPTSTSTPLPPTATPTTTPLPIEVRIWEADGAEMVFIPEGPFIMGSDTLGEDEQPIREVHLDSFWIDRYEVTNKYFARFVAETEYETEAERRGWGWVRTGGEWKETDGADWRHPRGPDSSIEDKMDHPVVLVSWNDADAYCSWVQKSLPTEAQWEKAARGSFNDEVEQYYAWGQEFDSDKANTEEANQNDTTPVGHFSPQGDSPYGAADMTGNVWEWVADWYGSDYYQKAPSSNPQGPANGTDKILRGGSWLFDAFYARTAFRYNIRPDYTYDFSGFRCSSSQ